MSVTIREILPSDNAPLAKIIRTALEEFGVAKPGTVYFDASTDALHALFQMTGAMYFVAVENNMVLGGAGIFPTAGLPPGTAELVKMYLSPEVRGRGLGKRLIQHCEAWAAQNGYTHIYLETMPELAKAVDTYLHLGYGKLDRPLGDTGHHGCNIWMLKSVPDA